ncbi:MAG: hypothetical protein R3B91_13690 [Planctomycetaceae bacterium]
MLGLLSYELGRCWERLPRATHDEFELPVMLLGVYDGCSHGIMSTGEHGSSPMVEPEERLKPNVQGSRPPD